MKAIKPSGCGQADCGCCTGSARLTPRQTANRPGLESLAWRIGTHGAFLQTMQSRLSSHRLVDAAAGADRPLSALTTRSTADPAMALLDAWATVADVLCFYQERIANEGFLRTAREMRSVHELARLVGYRPRPGVAASVYLAYTIDDKTTEEVVVAKGARSQTVPGPGETPQSFETGEDLPARAAWNLLRPRTTLPQRFDRVVETTKRLYVAGVATTLKPGDALLLVDTAYENKADEEDKKKRELVRITQVETDLKKDRTRIAFEPWLATKNDTRAVVKPDAGDDNTAATVVDKLSIPPSQPLSNALQLQRALEPGSGEIGEIGDVGLQVLTAIAPELRGTIGPALSGIAGLAPEPTLEVFAFRVRAGLFGRTVSKRQKIVRRARQTETEFQIVGEWPIVDIAADPPTVKSVAESTKVIHLESGHDGILPGSWIVVDSSAVRPDKRAMVAPADGARAPGGILITAATAVHSRVARAAYGSAGETTRIDLADPWIAFADSLGKDAQDEPLVPQDLDPPAPPEAVDLDFRVIRATTVYAQSEKLVLAEEPIDESLCSSDAEDKPMPIELDGLYQGLQPGRFVIVTGHRDGFSDETVVEASEPLMIKEVAHDVRVADRPVPVTSVSKDQNERMRIALPGDRIHTFVWFDRKLNYCYRLDTVRIDGNVVKATHGETRIETLGGGDGSKALQSFTLKQSPLTYLAAPTAAGAESTLDVAVNGLRWRERVSFVDALPTDRIFVTKADDAGKTTLVFGDGREGARLPTGLENVKAVYRNGIGSAGNARARQISQLSTRPLGVKDVINPLRASGGADAEGRDQVRRNTPNAVMALDRLVATRDYADFARGFAGIAKAEATEIRVGELNVLHVTIAGTGDVPIDPDSDLFVSLFRALRELGDPHQKIKLKMRELLVIVIEASVRIDPDYRWETVATDLRARLLGAFGFDKRELGQDVVASEVLGVMQSVPGVQAVDLDVLGHLASTVDSGLTRSGYRPATPAEIARELANVVKTKAAPLPRLPVKLAWHDGKRYRPAQLAALLPDVPATLVLNQMTGA